MDQANPPAPAAEKPIHRIQLGIVRGSIWKSGLPEKPVYTLTLDRVVTDKARNEHVTQVFESSDVRHLAKVTRECAAWIEWQERYRTERAQLRR
jgi:hypothetical protein